MARPKAPVAGRGRGEGVRGNERLDGAPSHSPKAGGGRREGAGSGGDTRGVRRSVERLETRRKIADYLERTRIWAAEREARSRMTPRQRHINHAESTLCGDLMSHIVGQEGRAANSSPGQCDIAKVIALTKEALEAGTDGHQRGRAPRGRRSSRGRPQVGEREPRACLTAHSSEPACRRTRRPPCYKYGGRLFYAAGDPPLCISPSTG